MVAADPVVLAIDAMSGDHGHKVIVDAALLALSSHPDLHLVLVGDEPTLRATLEMRHASDNARIQLQHAAEVVAMDESPSKVLRGKKDSSMRVAIDAVKSGRAQAAVSAGNTGALMATAKFVLKTLPGIDRPAIISPLPSQRGRVYMLDLGANAECSAEQLLQFAIMGAALVTTAEGIERPRVALLNIGEEEIKGNETIRQAARLLQDSPLNYVGFVEGDGIFLKDLDVVVCDGFVGNIALKAGEGVAKLLAYYIKQEFQRSLLTRMSAMLVLPVLKALKGRMDPGRLNGASFVGLNGIVIKSHGSADAQAFAAAIDVAVRAVQQALPHRITGLLKAALPPSVKD